MKQPGLHDIADVLHASGHTAEYDAFMRLIKILTPAQVREWEAREEQRTARRSQPNANS